MDRKVVAQAHPRPIKGRALVISTHNSFQSRSDHLQQKNDYYAYRPANLPSPIASYCVRVDRVVCDNCQIFIYGDMAKTKQTERKPTSSGLPVARFPPPLIDLVPVIPGAPPLAPNVCPECRLTCSRHSSMVRHCALKHHSDPAGNQLTDAEIAKFQIQGVKRRSRLPVPSNQPSRQPSPEAGQSSSSGSRRSARLQPSPTLDVAADLVVSPSPSPTRGPTPVQDEPAEEDSGDESSDGEDLATALHMLLPPNPPINPQPVTSTVTSDTPAVIASTSAVPVTSAPPVPSTSTSSRHHHSDRGSKRHSTSTSDLAPLMKKSKQESRATVLRRLASDTPPQPLGRDSTMGRKPTRPGPVFAPAARPPVSAPVTHASTVTTRSRAPATVTTATVTAATADATTDTPVTMSGRVNRLPLSALFFEVKMSPGEAPDTIAHRMADIYEWTDAEVDEAEHRIADIQQIRWMEALDRRGEVPIVRTTEAVTAYFQTLDNFYQEAQNQLYNRRHY